MRKYWYRRILIMIVVFTVAIGGSYYYIESSNQALKEEVSAKTSEKSMVIPGGMPIGIYLETDGVMVLGTEGIKDISGKVKEPSEHLVKAGDYIKKINGKEVCDKKELVKEVECLSGENIILQIQRNDSVINVKTKAIEVKNEQYKLGIWVRDNAQGLGTITYLDSESKFGALGHGIHDIDTNELIRVSSGKLYTTSIKEIQKGKTGTPGGIEGIIIYNNYNLLGMIDENRMEGIFGTIDRIDTIFHNQTPIEVASIDEVHEGKAYIRCAVEGEIAEYEVQITKVDKNPREVNKGIMVEVTDKKLLEVTGGIVQGMSGSPILQNGKLVGAVTHVLVNDPTRGYGIFIENMLDAAG